VENSVLARELSVPGQNRTFEDKLNHDFKLICQGRSSLYGLLSRLFEREMDIETLEHLVCASKKESDGHASQLLPGSFLKQVEVKGLPNILKELGVEYTGLFLGSNRSRQVFPYESVYTSDEHLLMQDSRDKVVALYYAEQLDIKESFRLPEDHIACELAYMAHLNQLAAGAIKRDIVADSIAKQQNFLSQHILVWVPAFCADLSKATNSDFYSWIADLTRDFVESETETLLQLSTNLNELSARPV